MDDGQYPGETVLRQFSVARRQLVRRAPLLRPRHRPPGKRLRETLARRLRARGRPSRQDVLLVRQLRSRARIMHVPRGAVALTAVRRVRRVPC